MTLQPSNAPLACSLSDAHLRKRKQTLLAQFSSAVISTEELPEGYAFQIPCDAKSIMTAAEVIAAERECCTFLTFELIAQQNEGSVTLRVTGASGTKRLIAELFWNSGFGFETARSAR